MVKVEFSSEALKDLTTEQRDQLYYLAGPHMKLVQVYKAFELPDDYVAVKLHYNQGNVIYGGIDAEGRLST